jgi:predicted RNA-binding Zn ribbon-like protein
MKITSTGDLSDLEIIGGSLSLDFVNTIDPRYREPRVEYLPDYGSVLAWATRLRAISEADARILARAAERRPDLARGVHRRAIRLRDRIYELAAPDPEAPRLDRALRTFNGEVRRAAAATTLVRTDNDYRLGWVPLDRLDSVLWPVVQSAVDLLTSPSTGRIRECEGEGCGWLFIDTSKAGRRRWCSMASCGNREKYRRHHARKAT